MGVEIDDVSWDEFPPSLMLSGTEFYDQFEAVKRFLSSQEQGRLALSRKIEDCEQRIRQAVGEEREWLIEGDYLDLFYRLVYDDAARSMASVGMLAPLVESLFKRLARVLELEWPRSGRAPVDVILKLIEDCSMNQMPADLEPVLRALFRYRNNMMHLGFEWPLNERHEFERVIRESDWPSTWFDQATQGHPPWLFYMSGEFISRCIEIVEGIMKAVTEYIEQQGIDFFWRTRKEVPQ